MSDAPSTASILDPVEAEQARISAPVRPRPLGSPLASLVASARRLTNKDVSSRVGFGKAQAWQEDGWEMFDLIGEQRFLTTTLANRVSQARLYVGKVPDNPVEAPEPLENDESLPARVFAHFGTTPAQRSQMINRQACNLFVAGDGWFAGIPKHLMPGAEKPQDEMPGLKELTLDQLEWRMLSVTEVSHGRGEVVLRLGEDVTEQIRCAPDDVFLIRVWRGHPRKSWEADSPTRSSLPVLRELVGLTMGISAQIDSRLAGAGILIVPASAKRALQVAAGIPEDSDEDPFTEALIEAMITPIQNRASASAVVPLVVVVPDEACDKFQHLTFSQDMDTESRPLREEAIRRLALGQDAPPELLLGTAGMNHWGAWLVREDVVTTHIEPPLALICDAITTQYLWPVLIEAGMDEDEAREYVVWYDVGHMVQRPNRLADALTLHDKGVVGDETLREAGGFTDDDAPAKISRSVELAIDIATQHPNLIDNLPAIIAAFDGILNPVEAKAAASREGAPTQDVDVQEGVGDDAPADSTSQVVGNPNPRPGARPARTARGTDTDTADESARTRRDPAAPPGGFSTLGDQDDPANAGLAAVIHLDAYTACPDDCRYCALDRSLRAKTVGKIRATKPGWAPRPPVLTAAAEAQGEGFEDKHPRDALGRFTYKEDTGKGEAKIGTKDKDAPQHPDGKVHGRISAAQAILVAAGLLDPTAGNDGQAVDGKLGTHTRAALVAYQKKNGLEETGRLDAATMKAMGIDSDGNPVDVGKKAAAASAKVEVAGDYDDAVKNGKPLDLTGPESTVTKEQVEALIKAGWKGDPNDESERLYPPGTKFALTAAAGMDDSVCIVAIPANADTLPGPEEKHATLISLGPIVDTADAELKKIVHDVTGAVADLWGPVTEKVAGVGTLGDNEAVVMFLSADSLDAIRNELLGDPIVGGLYETGDFTRYPHFRAHVTLGYGRDVTDADRERADLEGAITFDALEVWWGNQRTRYPFGQAAPTLFDEPPPVPDDSPVVALTELAGDTVALDRMGPGETDAVPQISAEDKGGPSVCTCAEPALRVVDGVTVCAKCGRASR